MIMEENQATEELTTYLYFGSSTNTVIDAPLIESLDKEFITKKEQTFTLDGNGGYIYFAYPKEFGT
jgi:hypothetical protein